MSDTPNRDWFIKVDSVCSLVGNRRYGLADDELARELIEVSGEARRFADTVGDRYVGGFPITLEAMVAHAAASGRLEELASKVAEHHGKTTTKRGGLVSRTDS